MEKGISLFKPLLQQPTAIISDPATLKGGFGYSN